MIINAILFIIKNIVSLLLAPLEIINIIVDFLASMPVILQFFQIIAYIIPWTNLIPLFLIMFSITGFRITVSFVKTLWNLIGLG